MIATRCCGERTSGRRPRAARIAYAGDGCPSSTRARAGADPRRGERRRRPRAAAPRPRGISGRCRRRRAAEPAPCRIAWRTRPHASASGRAAVEHDPRERRRRDEPGRRSAAPRRHRRCANIGIRAGTTEAIPRWMLSISARRRAWPTVRAARVVAQRDAGGARAAQRAARRRAGGDPALRQNSMPTRPRAAHERERGPRTARRRVEALLAAAAPRRGRSRAARVVRSVAARGRGANVVARHGEVGARTRGGRARGSGSIARSGPACTRSFRCGASTAPARASRHARVDRPVEQRGRRRARRNRRRAPPRASQARGRAQQPRADLFSGAARLGSGLESAGTAVRRATSAAARSSDSRAGRRRRRRARSHAASRRGVRAASTQSPAARGRRRDASSARAGGARCGRT